MSDIRQQTTEHMLADLTELPESERAGRLRSVEKLFGEDQIAFWGRLALEKPKYPLEAYAELPPDIQEGEEQPGKGAVSPLILGTYTLGFSSPDPEPGVITLYGENLKRYFQSLLWELRREFPDYPADRDTARYIAEWVVDKTYWHERFHLDMDAMRFLFEIPTPKLPCDREEALAVAFSRRWLTERYRFASRRPLPLLLWQALMNYGFRYRTRGYRDWGQYVDEAGFHQGLLAHLNGKRYPRRYRFWWPHIRPMLLEALIERGVELDSIPASGDVWWGLYWDAHFPATALTLPLVTGGFNEKIM